MLGAEFDGVLVRDGWAPYRQFEVRRIRPVWRILMSRLLDLLAAPGTVPDCQRLAARLTTELPAVFGFLFELTLDATNWRAEQALRPAVVNRKLSGSNRSERGAETQEILSSIVQTARLRDLDFRDVLVDLLRSRHPTVSPALSALL